MKIISLLKATYLSWSENQAPRSAAALSYYTIFSLAPLLLMAIAFAGFFWGEEAVQGRVLHQISDLVGVDGARAIEAMLKGAHRSDGGLVATLIGLLALFFGATGLFVEMQAALDTVWQVKPMRNGGMIKYIKDRCLSFSIVLSLAFLFLVSLVFSAVLSFITEFSTNLLPAPALLIDVINIVFFIFLTSGLFSTIFKILPGVYLSWSQVWAGGLLSAFLFYFGKSLLGLYLGTTALSSSYGAAGSLVVILLWSNYTAQILLFGAEFVRVQTNDSQKQPQLKPHFMFSQDHSGTGESH